MLLDEAIQRLKIGSCESDIPTKQIVDAVLRESESRDLFVQLADRDRRVIPCLRTGFDDFERPLPVSLCGHRRSTSLGIYRDAIQPTRIPANAYALERDPIATVFG